MKSIDLFLHLGLETWFVLLPHFGIQCIQLLSEHILTLFLVNIKNPLTSILAGFI